LEVSTAGQRPWGLADKGNMHFQFSGKLCFQVQYPVFAVDVASNGKEVSV